MYYFVILVLHLCWANVYIELIRKFISSGSNAKYIVIFDQFEIQQTSYLVEIFRQFDFGFRCTNGSILCDIIIDVKLIAYSI